MNSKNTFIVITGASSGIGAACARVFSHKGYGVILNGRSEEKLIKVTDQLTTESHIVVGDICSQSTIKKIKELCNKKPIAGLVNNAGIYERIAFEKTDSKSWEEQFQTNILAPATLTRELLPNLRKHKNPAIVNVASTLGIKPVSHTAAYSASKAAMINWTQTLALELAPQFRVNCVCPGIIDTPLHSFTNEQKLALQTAQPLGRVGRPLEIASAVYFLFASPWTTGAILPVDGGIGLT